MGLEFPKYPGDVSDGDERAYSPHKTTDSLLAAERGTDSTRRIETDGNRNLYVNVAGNSSLPSSIDTLATGAQTSVAANLLTTIVTLTAATAKGITKVSVSGTEYAKFQLFKNTNLIDTKRTGPDRSVDFVFINPLSMSAGDILDVKVTHFHGTILIDVEASIYGA
jgi:hypothetical protein